MVSGLLFQKVHSVQGYVLSFAQNAEATGESCGELCEDFVGDFVERLCVTCVQSCTYNILDHRGERKSHGVYLMLA